jgi:hypothetical protein
MARSSIPGGGIIKDIGTGVNDVAKFAVPGVGESEQVFGALTQKNTYIRVGETVVGLMMIYVGLKGFFPSAVNVVTSTGKSAAKGALLA